ncbi:molybdopterin molybdenumtransferase MoeA [Magnetovibrio blakemorei]|uniref:Molybdopterin molybdenumtransferase n=2 Tax=Magnetovibrio blakemorei TaxID=28181 RepID=A0A1E5Q9E0_9PROT|nr:molybdopterin molybdenumtransferase MoeA [Magnetovibrio blakemorei]
MIPASDALSQIIAAMKPTCAEQVALPDALGRILAEDVLARLTQPWADVSAMDGYAVRQEDVAQVSAQAPATLKVIGESAAGGSFDGDVGPGCAVRIFTGAPVPKGTDTIIIQEDTEAAGEAITVLEKAPAGKFIRPAGLDFKADTVLLKAGSLMSGRNVGLAAAANVPWVKVRRKPRIALIATGNEVVMPGDTLGDNQIISSNSVMLSAFIKVLGGEPLDLGIARDDLGSLTERVRAAKQADMLITIGGASVGDYDLVGQVLLQEGLQLAFDKVAMRPGKPVIFGLLDGMPVLGMPGNPVSVGVSSAVFLRPAIAAMLSVPATDAPLQTAQLAIDLGGNDERQEYMRATLSIGADGEHLVTPFSKQDSAMLAKFAEADCLVIRAPFAPPAKAGDTVDFIPLHTGRITL